MNAGDLVRLLDEAAHRAPARETVVSIHLFGIDHADDLRGISIPALVRAAHVRDSYVTEIRKGMKLAEYVRRR